MANDLADKLRQLLRDDLSPRELELLTRDVVGSVVDAEAVRWLQELHDLSERQKNGKS